MVKEEKPTKDRVMTLATKWTIWVIHLLAHNSSTINTIWDLLLMKKPRHRAVSKLLFTANFRMRLGKKLEQDQILTRTLLTKGLSLIQAQFLQLKIITMPRSPKQEHSPILAKVLNAHGRPRRSTHTTASGLVRPEPALLRLKWKVTVRLKYTHLHLSHVPQMSGSTSLSKRAPHM